MSICSGLGNGIGGALGKWGAGLGSALGLGAVVDVGVRAYTGYGLLDTLSVPYIECPNGSFASAIEWYGSGLKCPAKKPEPSSSSDSASTQKGAVSAYEAEIRALGGALTKFWGYYEYDFQLKGTMGGIWGEHRPGYFKADSQSSGSDKLGNFMQSGLITGANFGNFSYGGMFLDMTFTTEREGMFGSYKYTNRRYQNFERVWLKSTPDSPWRYLGGLVSTPENYSKAPPAAQIPPPAGFSPPKPPKPPNCEMSCPCITPADIERAIKKALGLTPFAPEKLIKELGAKMYAAPGPSLIPIAPVNLVEAIAALVATTYMRAGYGRYPVMMPQSMINDDSITEAVPALPLENFAEWFEWFLKQQDAVQGEWPIDIAIVDGAKRQPLKFENMSEAFAEVTGLLIQAATDADAAVSVASHAAVAATKAQTAAVIAQKNVECVIKFFGIRTGYGSIFVDSVITPMDSDNPNFNLKKFLTPSKQSVAFLTDNDPFDFQATLDRILRNSEIAKSAVAMDASKELVGDYARNQRRYDAAESKREAEKELEKLEASLKVQNPEIKIKLKVDTPTAGEIAGNNFVIKRPQT